MKKILFFSAIIIMTLLIAFFPHLEGVRADVCCRGRCGSGPWTGWFLSSNCSFEIHDLCGTGPYSSQTKPAASCPY